MPAAGSISTWTCVPSGTGTRTEPRSIRGTLSSGASALNSCAPGEFTLVRLGRGSGGAR